MEHAHAFTQKIKKMLVHFKLANETWMKIEGLKFTYLHYYLSLDVKKSWGYNYKNQSWFNKQNKKILTLTLSTNLYHK